MKIIVKCVVCLCLSVMTAAVSALPGFAQEAVDIAKNPHVLFLSSYSYEWESIPLQLEGISGTLNGFANTDYVFMDTKRIPYEHAKGEVYRHIANHSETDPYDYVIAGDDAALMFVQEYRDVLFEGIPVIFEGINNEENAFAAAEDPLVTGIVEVFPLNETIELALKLNPDAERVVAITDDSISGVGSTQQFLNCEGGFPELEFSLINSSELTIDELGREIGSLGDETILIFLMMTSDADQNSYTNTEAVEFVSECANIPVYKADELGIGSGILGGMVISYRDMAADAASIVLSLAGGADISDFPVRIAGSYFTLDCVQMERFGITEADIIEAFGSDVKYVNEKVSFIMLHGNVIFPLFAVITLLLVFSVFAVMIIHSKKILMDELEDKSRMLNNVLDNMPGGVVIYRIRGDSQKDIETVYFSHGVPKLSGRTDDEYKKWIGGELFQDCVESDDIPRIVEAIKENVSQKLPVYLNFRQKNKNGSTMLISLSAVWGYDEKDGARIYYALFLDVSQQEKARQAEREALEAKASSAAKSEFLSRMSHDIRTPLNAVLGFTAIALDESGNPQSTREYLEKIERSGKYLLGLINDVLDMAKIESGKLELHEESLDGYQLISGLADVFSAQAAENGIALIRDFSLDNPCWVIMDGLRTRQIYSNLLSNAIKFSTGGGEIRWTVKAEKSGEDTLHIVSRISDQGCGMSEEFMDRIFLPFEQDNLSQNTGGTGLGLPIVKNLVTVMGGTVKVESAPGKGSSFTVELDRKLGTPLEIARETVSHSTSLSGSRILLCEDNRVNYIVAEKLLERAGCSVDWAEDGSICLDRFSASADGYYDAILMDIRMPVMNGLESAAAIRALDRRDAKSVPIIAMSANAFDEDVRKSLSAGMNAHISKPINPELLYQTLYETIKAERNKHDAVR